MKRARSSNIDLKAEKKTGIVDSIRQVEDKAAISYTSRVFNLKEAPTFYPTTEDFSNPYDYIKKIQPSAEDFGICKIVPPILLSPESCINLKTIFLQQPELPSVTGQKKSIQPDTTPKIKNEEYMNQLFQYHSDNGQPIYKPPHLDHKPVDLFKLKIEVALRGGFSKVTTEKKWAEIGRAMNYSGKTCTSLSNSLKTMYSKFVMPFELHISNSGSSSPSKRPLDIDSSSDSRMNNTSDDHETDSINSDHSSNYSTSNSKRSKKNRKGRDRVAQNITFDQTVPDPDYVVCEICNNGDDEGAMLLCDGCNRGFHIYCLRPPLKSIPTTDWFCPQCLGEVENFRQSEDIPSLYSFRNNADEFKTKWFEKKKNRKRGNPNKITNYEVEEEFWKVIENEYKDLKIPNVSNLPTAQYGGGFPTIEKNPSEDDALLSWNPNVISLLPDSLFSHIRSNISELVSPRLNVGMCFSSSPWKQEPHSAYLIDYMHIGETKTWYSVPAGEDSKFEMTMRDFLSDSLKRETDFPFSLETMVSPKVLIDNSTKVFAIDQQQGEIIITFPGSYHSSFSHGFNLGESVNFATSDWHSFGLTCVNRYKQYRKSPYFSHDNFLVTIANGDQSIRTAIWLKDAIQEMVNRELETRRRIRENLSPLREVVDRSNSSMVHIQCDYCHAFSYLSSLGCECGNKIVCPDHFEHLCECEPTRRCLRLRWPDDELEGMAHRVKERADVPVEWVHKLQSVLSNNPVPSIDLLKALLSDAEKMPVEIEEAAYLKQFIDRAEQWSSQANKIITRRNNNYLVNPNSTLDDTYISNLVLEAITLNLNSPEVDFLEQLDQKIKKLKSSIAMVVNDENIDIQELQKLYTLGNSYGINIKELSLLKKSISKKEWCRLVQTAYDNPYTMEAAKELINTAQDHEIADNDTTLKRLRAAWEQASQWEESCSLALSQDSITLEKLEILLQTSQNSMVVPSQVTEVRDMISTTQKLIAEAIVLLQQGANPNVQQRPSEKHLKDMIECFKKIPVKTEEFGLLYQASEAVQKWRNTLQDIFHPYASDSNTFDILYNVLDNVRYCSRLSIEDARCSHGCFTFECSACQTSERKSETRQPKLDDLFKLLREADKLEFVPIERNLLINIVNSASALKSQIRRFISSRDVTVDDMGQLKLYLHKTERMDVCLDQEIHQLQQLLKMIEFNSKVDPMSLRNECLDRTCTKKGSCAPSVLPIEDHSYLQGVQNLPRKDGYYEKPPTLIVDYNSTQASGSMSPRAVDHSEQSIKMVGSRYQISDMSKVNMLTKPKNTHRPQKMSIVDTILNNEDPGPRPTTNRATSSQDSRSTQNTTLIELSDDDDTRVQTNPISSALSSLQVINHPSSGIDNHIQPQPAEAIVIEDDSETETDEEVELIRRTRKPQHLPNESPKPILY